MSPDGDAPSAPHAAGFLTALVERAARRVPVLERRRPSLFEPRSARANGSAPVEAAEELDAGGPGERAASPERDEPPRASPRRAQARGAETEPASERPEVESPSRERRRDPEPRPGARARPSDALGRPEERARPDGAPARAPLPRPTADASDVPSAAPTANEILRSERVRTESRREAAAEVAPRPRELARSVSERPRLPARSPKPEEASPRAARASLSSSRAPVAQPARIAAARAAAAPPASASRPAPVHVSIGRIEVRASVAAPAAAPARRPGPRLTLDEYLRRRDGGAR